VEETGRLPVAGRAGVVGPQAAAWLKDHCGTSAATYSFAVGAGLLAVGLMASFCLAGSSGHAKPGKTSSATASETAHGK